MKSFKQYRRTQIAEMRPVEAWECRAFHTSYPKLLTDDAIEVSISKEDLKNGSPKIGDMIARNPKNHADQWLVAKKYFEDNFETI